MIVSIDGNALKTEKDFHRAIAKQLDFGPYYGHNLDALWDRMTTDVERPIKLIWMDSNVSAANLGQDFERIVKVLRDVEKWDKGFNWQDCFELELQ